MIILFKNEKPFIEGVCLNELTTTMETPFYVYSQKSITDAYDKLKNSLIIPDKISKSKIIKSARNIPNLKIIDQEGANVYDLLKYKNVIFTITSIKSLQDRLSK